MIVPMSIIIFWVNALTSAELIDLGHDLSDLNPVYPTPLYLENRFKLTVHISPDMIDREKYKFATNSFCSIEHFGTHVDAPTHFFADKWSMEQIPKEHLVANAVVINVQEKAEKFRNYAISRQDVAEWIDQYGPIPNNSVIIANTGWYKKFYNSTAYFGHATNISLFNSPGFSAETIKLLNSFEKTHGIRIFGYGIDTISLDPIDSTSFPAHLESQGSNQYVIENLDNLDALPAKGATLMVMPMKIKGGTGAPARVMAQLPYNSYVDQTNPRISGPRK